MTPRMARLAALAFLAAAGCNPDSQVARATRMIVADAPPSPDGPSTSSAVIAAPAGFLAVVTSAATNLAVPNPGGVPQVYLADLGVDPPALTRMSATPAGAAGDAPSHSPTVGFRGGLSLVAFVSTASNFAAAPGAFAQVYLRSSDGQLVLASSPDGSTGGNQTSSEPHLAADGSALVFTSMADDLGPATTLGRRNVYRRLVTGVAPLALGPVELVSGGGGGPAEGNADSFGGRVSSADPLVNPGDPGAVVFATEATNFLGSDTNGARDVLVRSFPSGFSRVEPGGLQPNADTDTPDVSLDGTTLAFRSEATNLIPAGSNGLAQVYSAALPLTGTFALVSLGADGLPADGACSGPRVVVAGAQTTVLYLSSAFNLVPGVGSGFPAAFVKRGTDPTFLASRRSAGDPALLPVSGAAVAATATQIASVFTTASILGTVFHDTPQAYVYTVTP